MRPPVLDAPRLQTAREEAPAPRPVEKRRGHKPEDFAALLHQASAPAQQEPPRLGGAPEARGDSEAHGAILGAASANLTDLAHDFVDAPALALLGEPGARTPDALGLALDQLRATLAQATRAPDPEAGDAASFTGILQKARHAEPPPQDAGDLLQAMMAADRASEGVALLQPEPGAREAAFDPRPTEDHAPVTESAPTSRREEPGRAPTQDEPERQLQRLAEVQGATSQAPQPEAGQAPQPEPGAFGAILESTQASRAPAPLAPQAPAAPVAPVALPHELVEGQLGHDRARVVVGEGDQRVEISVEARHGHIRVEMAAATPELAQSLRGHTQDLQAALSERGLSLGSFSASADGRQPQAHAPTEDADEPSAPASSTTSTPEPTPRRGVRAIA